MLLYLMRNPTGLPLRSQVSNNVLRPSNTVRPNDNGNRRTDGGFNLVYENYGSNGHTIDICFKIIGYRSDLGKKKIGQNFKRENVSNNTVSSSSSSGFFDEHCLLLSLFSKKILLTGKVCMLIWQEKSYPSPNRYVTPSPHSGSIFKPLNVSERGYSQGSKVVASEEERNNTWDLVDLPKGRKAIGSKWVWKIRYKSDGEIERYKASLISKPKDDDPLLKNFTNYQKLIGKLIYLTTTRPDIANIVSCLSEFIHNPFKSYLKTALKVIRYLKGFLEAEYRVLVSVTSEVNWVLKILKDLDCSNMLPVKSVREAIDNPNFSNRGSLWLDLIREFLYLNHKGIDLLPSIKRKLENDENTLFWEDIWLGEANLKTKYLRLFALELRKGSIVAAKTGQPS
uniref:Ribonuclease H-like domain-containing protein n=1 Tax=Tanacetum cinerariifolium TaxID=118510 RepID=A0A6L2NS75_TANCI|nr:ribonuclease H-like domain-containing protein [Tanacetum cinerariifolium]